MAPLDYFSLPILLPAVFEKLLGRSGSKSPIPVANVSADGRRISIRGSDDVRRYHLELDIAPEARDFALRLRHLLAQLIRDGAEPCSVIIDMDEAGWPVAKTRRPRRRRQAVDRIRCDLRHGVQLTVWNTSGELRIRAVGDFLAQAMKHFKEEMVDADVDLYSGGPYYATIKSGRKVIGRMQLACTKEEWLKPALWADSVIAAYSNVSTVEEMLPSLPEWRKATLREDSHLREVFSLLETQGGELLAMAAMLKHSLTSH